MKEEGRTERQREGDGAVRMRLPRFPLLLILVSLGLLVVFPLVTILLIDRAAEELQWVVEPAHQAIADFQIELAIEVTALRAFWLVDDPTYRRQYLAARERRNEALSVIEGLEEELDPTVRSALANLAVILEDFDRIVDGVFSGEIARELSRDILAEQHVRFLAGLESGAAIERALLDREVGLVDRYRRTIVAGFVVESLLVVIALVAGAGSRSEESAERGRRLPPALAPAGEGRAFRQDGKPNRPGAALGAQGPRPPRQPARIRPGRDRGDPGGIRTPRSAGDPGGDRRGIPSPGREEGASTPFTLWLPLLPPREVADDVQGAGRTPVER